MNPILDYILSVARLDQPKFTAKEIIYAEIICCDYYHGHYISKEKINFLESLLNRKAS